MVRSSGIYHARKLPSPSPAPLKAAFFVSGQPDPRPITCRFHAGENMVATYNGEDIWGVVHQSGLGLLAGRVGELTAYNLGKTLLRLAVAGQEGGRVGGSKLTARWGVSGLRKILNLINDSYSGYRGGL